MHSIFSCVIVLQRKLIKTPNKHLIKFTHITKKTVHLILSTLVYEN